MLRVVHGEVVGRAAALLNMRWRGRGEAEGGVLQRVETGWWLLCRGIGIKASIMLCFYKHCYLRR